MRVFAVGLLISFALFLMALNLYGIYELISLFGRSKKYSKQITHEEQSEYGIESSTRPHKVKYKFDKSTGVWTKTNIPVYLPVDTTTSRYGSRDGTTTTRYGSRDGTTTNRYGGREKAITRYGSRDDTTTARYGARERTTTRYGSRDKYTTTSYDAARDRDHWRTRYHPTTTMAPVNNQHHMALTTRPPPRSSTHSYHHRQHMSTTTTPSTTHPFTHRPPTTRQPPYQWRTSTGRAPAITITSVAVKTTTLRKTPTSRQRVFIPDRIVTQPQPSTTTTTTTTTSTTKSTSTTTTTTAEPVTVPSSTEVTTTTESKHEQEDNSAEHVPELYSRPPPENEITLVTALLDIGRGDWFEYRRPLEKYHQFMENVLSLKVNMVVFTDNSSYDFVKAYRDKMGFANRTRVYNISLADVPLNSFLPQAHDIITKELSTPELWKGWDPQMQKHPEAKSAEYNILVNSKTYFMYNATLEDPFNNEYYVWLDAGYGHGDQTPFPVDNTWTPRFPKRKISLIKITPEHDKVHKYTLERLYRQNWSVISGGFIAGDKHSIGQLYALVHRRVAQMILQDQIDDDQTVLVLIIKSHPHLFNIVHGMWFDGFRLFPSSP